jgi:hypothetical protein
MPGAAVRRPWRALPGASYDRTLAIMLSAAIHQVGLSLISAVANTALRVLDCGCLSAGRRPACSRLGIQAGGDGGFVVVAQAGVWKAKSMREQLSAIWQAPRL